MDEQSPRLQFNSQHIRHRGLRWSSEAADVIEIDQKAFWRRISSVITRVIGYVSQLQGATKGCGIQRLNERGARREEQSGGEAGQKVREWAVPSCGCLRLILTIHNLGQEQTHGIHHEFTAEACSVQ